MLWVFHDLLCVCITIIAHSCDVCKYGNNKKYIKVQKLHQVTVSGDETMFCYYFFFVILLLLFRRF